MDTIIEDILLDISRNTTSTCLILFGSGGRSDLLPGSDLDIVAIVSYTQHWKYNPTVVGGMWIDLNYVCNEGLTAKLESSWYWRAQLRHYKMHGLSMKISDILTYNKRLGTSAKERKIICDGWKQLSVNHFSSAERTDLEWVRQGMEWHGIISLMNGILQLGGLVPHSYHNHITEIKKSYIPNDIMSKYLEFTSSSYHDLIEIPLWIKQISHQLSNIALEIKIKATEERINYLHSLGRNREAAFYLRHAIWILLVHVACQITDEIFPSIQEEYGVVIAKIDNMIPENVKNCFLRKDHIETATLRTELIEYLTNKVL